MLLARVAEDLYWAARYLQRATSTARIVREHTNVLMDMPTSVPLTWEPLLAITGSRTRFDELHPIADEPSIMHFLIADEANPGSLVSSFTQARENLRTARPTIPRELWQVVNDLYHFVANHRAEGVHRATRARFLDQVIIGHQRALGILASTMRRDEAYEFLRIGTNLELADMTTRVLDVRAVSLVEGGHDRPATHDSVQWTGVLRSLSGLQMYHRSTHRPVDPAMTVEFLLTDAAFPGAVAACLIEIDTALRRFSEPGPIAAVAAVEAELARRAAHLRESATAEATDGTTRVDGAELRQTMDRLQIAIGSIHEEIDRSFFALRATGTPEPVAPGPASSDA